jgi:hypothetical protein
MELSDAANFVYAVTSNRVGDSYNQQQQQNGSRRNWSHRSRTTSASSAMSNLVEDLASPSVDGGFQSLFGNGDADVSAVAPIAQLRVKADPKTPLQNGTNGVDKQKSVKVKRNPSSDRTFAFPFKVNFPVVDKKRPEIPTAEFLSASCGAIVLFGKITLIVLKPS